MDTFSRIVLGYHGCEPTFAEAPQDLQRKSLALPTNKGKRRNLDCLMINELVASADLERITYQTVRCPFLEGRRVYPSSGIYRESHIQVVVRDKHCILGVFRPTFS